LASSPDEAAPVAVVLDSGSIDKSVLAFPELRRHRERARAKWTSHDASYGSLISTMACLSGSAVTKRLCGVSSGKFLFTLEGLRWRTFNTRSPRRSA
jgi:hypothetical protein